MAGVLAAFITIVIATPIAYYVTPFVRSFIPGLSVFHYFYTHVFQIFAYELIFSICIGSLSSYIAIRRYLKN